MTSFRQTCFAVVLILGAAAAGIIQAQAIDLTPPQADLYNSVSILPPTSDRMPVCYGFGCRRRTYLDFTEGDRRTLTKIIAAGKASPGAERAAIQKAVVWFDKRMGPVIGTDKCVANADIRAGADATNYDCWDTTRNAASLLLVLQEWKLFKHHTVGNPRYRGNFLVGQLPHNTAVIVDKTSGIEWVVDMWPKSYAQPPDVMPADQWQAER